jgi:hypothetical protein
MAQRTTSIGVAIGWFDANVDQPEEEGVLALTEQWEENSP